MSRKPFVRHVKLDSKTVSNAVRESSRYGRQCIHAIAANFHPLLLLLHQVLDKAPEMELGGVKVNVFPVVLLRHRGHLVQIFSKVVTAESRCSSSAGTSSQSRPSVAAVALAEE